MGHGSHHKSRREREALRLPLAYLPSLTDGLQIARRLCRCKHERPMMWGVCGQR